MYLLHLPALILTIISLVAIFARNIQARKHNLPPVKPLLLLPYVLLVAMSWIPAYQVLFASNSIGGGGSGLAVTALGYYLGSTLAAAVGLVVSFSKGYKSLSFIGIFILATIILYAPEGIYAYENYHQAVVRGEIGGISQEQAVEASKSALKPGVNYQMVGVSKENNYYGDKAAWEVDYDVNGKDGQYVMTLMVMVDARNASVIPDSSMVPAEFTFLNKGKPSVGLEVSTEWADQTDENTILKHWDYDYGITDQNGKVKLLMRDSQDENVFIYITSGTNHTFYQINKPFKSSYTINLDNAAVRSY